jgi:hypothetical protein
MLRAAPAEADVFVDGLVPFSLEDVMSKRWRALLLAHIPLRNRLTGGLLIGAGLGLAFARRS